MRLTNMQLQTQILDQKVSYVTLNGLYVEMLCLWGFFFQIKLVVSLKDVAKDVSIVFL